MIRRLTAAVRATLEYCAKCGWWVTGCPHQT